MRQGGVPGRGGVTREDLVLGYSRNNIINGVHGILNTIIGNGKWRRGGGKLAMKPGVG